MRFILDIVATISKREAKKQQSRKAIVSSAIKLFSKKGLKDTSIADIMKEAQLGIGTFYNYFESKDELLRSLLNQIALDIRQYFIKTSQEKKLQAEVLEAVVLYSANLLEKNRFILPLFMLAIDKSALSSTNHTVIEKPLLFKDLFNDIIQAGQATGEFRTDIPSEIITEMFHSLFQTASFSTLPIKYQDNIRYKLILILAGIAK